jgi:hypothetical protein
LLNHVFRMGVVSKRFLDKTPMEFRDLRKYQQTAEINKMLKLHRRTNFCNLELGRFVQFRFLNVDASKFCNSFLVINYDSTV